MGEEEGGVMFDGGPSMLTNARSRSATATRRLGAPTATPQCLGGARPLSDGGNRAIRTSAVPVARNRCLVCVCVLSETCILIYVLAQAATGGNAIQARGVGGGERRVVFGRSASRRRREVRRDPDYAGASVVYSAVWQCASIYSAGGHGWQCPPGSGSRDPALECQRGREESGIHMRGGRTPMVLLLGR